MPQQPNVFDPTGAEAIRVALIDALACSSPQGLCSVCREAAEHALRELDTGQVFLPREDWQGLYDHLGTMPWAPGSWSNNLRNALSEVLATEPPVRQEL